MTQQLIAVAVTAEGQISAHAGRALDWQVYAVVDGTTQQAWSLQLTDSGCLHEWHVRPNPERHPLHAVDVAIAGSGGDGVKRRLLQRDTLLVETAETDPTKAIADYLAGSLLPGKGHDEDQCLDPEHHKATQA